MFYIKANVHTLNSHDTLKLLFFIILDINNRPIEYLGIHLRFEFFRKLIYIINDIMI